MEPIETVSCTRCAGDGEVIIDWDRYLHGDGEGTADCPECFGIGSYEVPGCSLVPEQFS